MRLGTMRFEQQQRYLEDIAAEEERCYQLGSLSGVPIGRGDIVGQNRDGGPHDALEEVFDRGAAT